MLDRIKLILKKYDLQHSSFADKIQVSRGTVSHILNGRNNPSRDTIEKIMIFFPEISSSWLLRGEGPMYKSESIIIPVSSSHPGQLDLFDEKQTVEPDGKPEANEYSKEKGVEKHEKITNSTVIKDIIPQKNTSKKIDKIVFFFDDNTCKIFIPEE